jgi:hypothetical protein
MRFIRRAFERIVEGTADPINILGTSERGKPAMPIGFKLLFAVFCAVMSKGLERWFV